MSGRFALVVAACFAFGLVIGYGAFQSPLAGMLPVDMRGTAQDFAVPERPFVPFPDQVGPAVIAPERDGSAAPSSTWDGYAPEDESRVG